MKLGDFYFVDTASNAVRSKLGGAKGGSAIFLVKDVTTGKAIKSVQFKWSQKRQLLVTVKGTPTPDPHCGVVNIVDLRAVADGKKVTGFVDACSVQFGETSFALPSGKAVPYSGKKSTKDGLMGWNVTGWLKPTTISQIKPHR